MIDEMDRANSIITEYLSLAKNKALDLKPRSLSAIVHNLLPLLQADALTRDCQVRAELEELPELPLDEKESRQMVVNLTRNGLEAMSGGGSVTISTSWNDPEVVLSVADQGPGIDPQVLGKIGTPFFTTKDQGTGLGLAVCYSIAARHRASIRVDTSARGTCFQVAFPTI
jgi:signal transduction histidine kinase